MSRENYGVSQSKLNMSPRQRRAEILSLISLLLMIIGSVGLDQISKVEAEEAFMVWQHPENLKQYQGKRLPVWSTGRVPEMNQQDSESDDFYVEFNLNYVRNQGAAWGFLSDWEDQYRIPFFYCVTFFAVLIIFWYIYMTPLSHRLARFTLALILSGAIGNFIDRFLRGYVIDFLDFRWSIPFPVGLSDTDSGFKWSSWEYYFPNFNWADSMITIGVFFLIYDMLILERLRKIKMPADAV